MNINFIFLVFHLWSFSSRALRVMVIGDSVDRYMVSDWCVENNGILYTDKTMNKFTALNELMSPHSRRFKSWEFRTCIALSRGINISYVFNRIGVRTREPFYMPITTVAGLNEEQKLLLKNSNSQEKSIMITIGPALKALTNPKVLGGPVEAVFLHSGFWDLSKRVNITVSNEKGDGHVVAKAMDKWIDNWYNNASILMSLMQKQYPEAHYFGWRYASDFSIAHHSHLAARNWHDLMAHKLKDKMNQKIKLLKDTNDSSGLNNLRSKRQYKILDHRLLHSPSARRDPLHLSRPACVQIFEVFLSNIDILNLR